MWEHTFPHSCRQSQGSVHVPAVAEIVAVTAKYPTLTIQILKTAQLFDSIKSWQDVDRILLHGQGLSPGTYKTYASTVRRFFEFTDQLSPLQCTVGHIETFYDAGKADGKAQKTIYNEVMALKNFFAGCERVAPGFISPFRNMDDKLVKKLKNQGHAHKKRALQQGEFKSLLSWLKQDVSLEGLHLYAIVNFLTATGLRAAEVSALRWKDLYLDETAGAWYCSGIGKGLKPFEQEIASVEAVDACLSYFKKAFKRDPRPEDPLFHGDKNEPINPHGLWYRLKKLGERAVRAGVITRELQFSPHLLRRTAGTLLDAAGMSPVGIQNFLRHESLETTANHYIDNRQKASPFLKEVFAGG
ncbi:MAG: tyrosine-type recombinase/integrase [Planctomycetes bacterium]|nr:tyrosine-type recombinase/integrase [Planctomycetota bacterium]